MGGFVRPPVMPSRPSPFAQRRPGLGNIIMQALQAIGQGLREKDYFDRLGPDWREKLNAEQAERESKVRMLPVQEEAAKYETAARRASLLKQAIDQASLAVGGESGDADLLPLQRNLTPGESQPAPPRVAIPDEVRRLYPDLSDEQLSSMVRGAYQQGKRPMELLRNYNRTALVDQRHENTLEALAKRSGLRLDEIEAWIAGRIKEKQTPGAPRIGDDPASKARREEQKRRYGLLSGAVDKERQGEQKLLKERDAAVSKLGQQLAAGKINETQYNSGVAAAERSHRERMTALSASMPDPFAMDQAAAPPEPSGVPPRPTIPEEPAAPSSAAVTNETGELTATGPNGEKLVLRNGQWVPLQ